MAYVTSVNLVDTIRLQAENRNLIVSCACKAHLLLNQVQKYARSVLLVHSLRLLEVLTIPRVNYVQMEPSLVLPVRFPVPHVLLVRMLQHQVQHHALRVL